MRRLNTIIVRIKVMQQFYIKLVNTSVSRPLNRVVCLAISKACVVGRVKAIEG
ncbi:hypothetical protein [Cellulosilyticum lentocellum]|uniref:hypothetical protein n=1 Tax=Cellulosilyticum lentocellum TaxID=29360 RepID=UPI0012FE8605|nr:hypothetical protein [Cellulosilyticum lentocellum]